MPYYSMIVAHARNHVIGRENTLPWRLSADLQYFKSATMGKPLLMGRKTYESIGRPLPGRRMLILSRDPSLSIEGCEVFNSIDALEAAFGHEEEIMVAGGAEIYRLFLNRAEKLYVTEVKTDVEGDARFPDYDFDEWNEVSREAHKRDDKNEYDYDFVVLERFS